MNLEYRFFDWPPLWVVQICTGPLFLDGGNIWTLDFDESRIGSQFSFKTTYANNGELMKNNFLKTMAISAGAGLRFDVSYFTFRADLGTPVKKHLSR